MAKLGWTIAALLVVAVCLWKVAEMYQREYATGGDFEKYSTYRADPYGLSAVYNALAEMPGLLVGRNETNPVLLDGGPDTTLIFAAVTRGPDPLPLVEALERFVHSGGRLVLTFDPNDAYDWAGGDCVKDPWHASISTEGELEADPDSPGESDSEGSDEEEAEFEDTVETVDTEIRWGYSVNCAPMLGASEGEVRLGTGVRAMEEPELPASVAWLSLLHFEGSGPLWKTIYTRDTMPVVLERQMGAGSIVLCSDTYPLSNEAQQKQRLPGFIAWLAGPSHTILFDEYHLGVSRDPNIMVLLQRYRLHYLLIALLGVALLFLWQSASPLTPRRPLHELEHRDAAASRRVQTGSMTYLLRRSLSRADLLSTCYAQWRDSAGRLRGLPEKEDLELRDLVRSVTEEGGPPAAIVWAYREMTQRIQKRSRL